MNMKKMDEHAACQIVALSWLTSGNLTVCYGKWPIEIVDLLIKHGEFPVRDLWTNTLPGTGFLAAFLAAFRRPQT